jgi:beta-glucosidase
MEPSRVYDILARVHKRFKKPIFITENGLADAADEHRQWWLQESITAMEKALAHGVDLRGYFHWSLVDNFEWAYGWWPKFGLIAVDRKNSMKRTIRPSAKWLATYLSKNKT